MKRQNIELVLVFGSWAFGKGKEGRLFSFLFFSKLSCTSGKKRGERRVREGDCKTKENRYSGWTSGD